MVFGQLKVSSYIVVHSHGSAPGACIKRIQLLLFSDCRQQYYYYYLLFGKQKIHHLALQTITLSSCIADRLFQCGCPQFSVLSYLSSQSFYTETHLYKSEFVSHFKPPPDVARIQLAKKITFHMFFCSLDFLKLILISSGYAKRGFWAGILNRVLVWFTWLHWA